MIWLTSDLHFGHEKDFIYKPRGFSSVEEMNEVIIERYNSVINNTDDVYILGDLIVGADAESNLNLINRLRGNKVLIRGNHDSDARIKLYQEELSIPVYDAKYLKIGKYNFYLSHYPTLTANFDKDKPLKARLICLCGHLHTKDPYINMKDGVIYHVEVDAHDCFPVAFDTVISDIKSKICEGKVDEK